MTRVSLSRLPGERVLVVDAAPSTRWRWPTCRRTCASARPTRRAGCGTTPRGGTRRCWRPGCGSGAATTCGWATACCGGRPPWTRGCWRASSRSTGTGCGRRAPSDPALFSVDDTAEHLRADLEDARQLAAVAASPEAARLGLLLAAESSGALVAAEMTYAGVPWRVDVHERLLTDLLGPRPPRGARPQRLEALVAEVRDAFDAPGLNPDSRPELLAALRRAGLDVTDTRASTLRALEHPGIEPLLRYKQLAHLFQTNGWAWIDQWVSGGRFRPSYQPAGSATGRWSSNGGGALSIPVQVRPAAVADDGWVFVVADVAQLEPRVLAGMSGDRALARSARGADLYQGMVDDGAVASRKDAKLGLLGAMYGATSGESGRMVAGLTRRYPHAFGLVEEAARAGERGEVVRTLLGRGSPGPGRRVGPRPRRPAGRPRRPGPATARLRPVHPQLRRAGHGRGVGAVLDRRPAQPALAPRRDGPLVARPHLVFFLHDEVVVHTPAALADAVAAEVTEAAATAAGLLFRDLAVDFPLNVSVVRSYAEAGKPGAAHA